MSEPILRAEALTVGYGAAPVIEGQALALAPGRITALVGPNGAGKSTLLKALAGQLRPSAGRVLLDGHAVARLPARAMAQRLGILFQQHPAPTGLTVAHLVAQGRHPHRRLFEPPTDADHAAVERALALTGAAAFRHRRLDTLSGGQRQLAWLALVLAQAPQVLLLDEPTTALDLRHQLELMAVIEGLRDEGLTVAMVVHDLNHAARHADHLVAVRAGRVVAQGPVAQVLTVDLVRAVFDVQVEILQTADGRPVCVPRAVAPAREVPECVEA
ncbi:MAG: ABC transporter ATP-binding protein [Myxococcales bacterium]|nr:ABC transporter ATP-binding protein [Myxococcales bacterium]